ncbi:DNA recombination protein RmuC [Bartonella henselae]|uniref:DNA recombination protein RmuC homolog n=1 Tax=Bartonella henselae (strain ATCC 49882 / DSM 28221 / CCUG 30454 / Houston 1) TaxID=283166 RepID=A0A0H3LVB7_BARHE|nr:DNA recombination protein RmuC [Bartonella henselae]ATP13089.1 DNA recombination protein RmuC [Bartonella henselae]MDM9990596.1 DNA recombination protein RmuC [Bartonella henselae]OLL39147.1 DNA recombinase [Bartonella henselae]OLL43774.1 DNA recombinase [Bartonella henselae]OLL57011.1 DNA recombinase [Bartonella henselae]
MFDSFFSFILADESFVKLSALLLLIFVCLVFFMLMHSYRKKALWESETAERSREVQMQMATLLKTQAEMQGRMQTMAEIFGQRQAELNKSLSEQLNGMTANLGQTLQVQTKSTYENLNRLQERLAVIDAAQNNIQSLAGQVVQLQAILSNKQTRGTFGQGRMEAIIADALPANAYIFQAVLSNGKRPDCLIHMPNKAPSLVVDAKFPLEAWNAMRKATSAQERQEAERQFRTDMEVHIRDIAQKYLISGETHDTAFLFVPSESIFATIYEDFESLVQKANRAHIIIVSPSLLMLSIQVVQTIMKDARMREQAHLIQSEVAKLMEDFGRMDTRIRALQKHFYKAGEDIEGILISSSKIMKRANRIETFQLKDNNSEPMEIKTSAQSQTLRLVDEE